MTSLSASELPQVHRPLPEISVDSSNSLVSPPGTIVRSRGRFACSTLPARH